jgi:hypothetical protein
MLSCFLERERWGSEFFNDKSDPLTGQERAG